MTNLELTFEEFYITTNNAKMDVIAIHDFLAKHSGSNRGIPIEKVRLSIENTINFGLSHERKQIGFAWIIPDYPAISHLRYIYMF